MKYTVVTDIWTLNWMRASMTCLALLFTCCAMSQTFSRKSSGEVIVTYSDGSWRYMLPTDSILMRDSYESFRLAELRAENPEPEPQVEAPEVVVPTPVVEPEVNESSEPIRSVIGLSDEKVKKLTERKLTLTERLRRVEAGYIKLSDKEMRKLQEELSEIKSQLEPAVAAQPVPEPVVINDDEEVSEQPSPVLESVGYQKSQYAFDLPKVGTGDAPCSISSMRDDFSGKLHATTDRDYFFQFSPEAMRAQLKGKHYLDAYVATAKVNDNIVLKITYEIRTANRKSTYGVLDRGSRLQLKLSNGEQVSLYNVAVESGQYDEVNNIYRYVARYIVDKDTEKQLLKNYIDTARVYWSVGFEDYTIYQVDRIQSQLRCLLNSL